MFPPSVLPYCSLYFQEIRIDIGRNSMHLCWSLRLLLLLDLIEGFLLTTRNFVVLCHNSATLADGSFSVNNLLEGRVDVLARVLTNSLFVSNGVRKSTSVTLLLSEQLLSITIDGSKIKGCNPDEVSERSERALRKTRRAYSRWIPRHPLQN